MKIYHIHRKQILPITLAETWDFFATPENLGTITPPHMRFKILSNSGSGKMFSGQIIKYKVRILPAIWVRWTTEIKDVVEHQEFIDIQARGPFSYWHHKHMFREVTDGVEMIDDIHYAVPFGILGRLVNAIFVNRQVNAIFDHRFKILAEHFSKTKTGTATV